MLIVQLFGLYDNVNDFLVKFLVMLNEFETICNVGNILLDSNEASCNSKIL